MQLGKEITIDTILHKQRSITKDVNLKYPKIQYQQKHHQIQQKLPQGMNENHFRKILREPK